MVNYAHSIGEDKDRQEGVNRGRTTKKGAFGVEVLRSSPGQARLHLGTVQVSTLFTWGWGEEEVLLSLSSLNP